MALMTVMLRVPIVLISVCQWASLIQCGILTMGCLVISWILWLWAAEVGAVIVWVWCDHAHAHLGWSWATDALQTLLWFLMRPGCSVDAIGVLAATVIGVRWSQSSRRMFCIPLCSAAHQLIFGIWLISACEGCRTSSGSSAEEFLADIVLLRHAWIHRMWWIRLQCQIQCSAWMALSSWASSSNSSLILSFHICCGREVPSYLFYTTKRTKVAHAVWVLMHSTHSSS